MISFVLCNFDQKATFSDGRVLGLLNEGEHRAVIKYFHEFVLNMIIEVFYLFIKLNHILKIKIFLPNSEFPPFFWDDKVQTAPEYFINVDQLFHLFLSSLDT